MKTFTFCPQIALPLCRHWFGDNHVHVVIRSPGGAPVMPACDRFAVFLEFHDLGENASEEYRAGLFTETHAQTIANFVEKTPEETLVVVNCEGGVSRSSGVVLALRRHYGGDTEEVFQKGVPNIFVTSMLSRVLRGA